MGRQYPGRPQPARREAPRRGCTLPALMLLGVMIGAAEALGHGAAWAMQLLATG